MRYHGIVIRVAHDSSNIALVFVRNLPALVLLLRPWSLWTANSDKKYLELNGAALNVNKPCVTCRKTAFPKDK